MARKLRIFIENVPVHIKLSSVDSINIFDDNDDVNYFLDLIEKLNSKFSVKIHSYVIHKEYFEFLVSPSTIESIPRFMQNLGRDYVIYFNKKYDRKGTLWSGRYKSSIVEEKKYLFDVMCYIEKKNNIVTSSIKKNLYNNEDKVITEHILYERLDSNQSNRADKYSYIFNNFNNVKAEFIEKCLERQAITGSSEYIKNLEKNLGKGLSSKSRGRPKKTIEQRNKMYKNLQILDKEKHKNIKISGVQNLDFLSNTTFVPIVSPEMTVIGDSFPIVFTGNKDSRLVSLISLGGINLAINENGKWINKYIPSFIRRYPFSLGKSREDETHKVILIDEASSILSEEKGKSLFKKSGEHSKFFEDAITYLKNNDKQAAMTQSITDEIVKSGILEDREISVGEGDEKKVLVKGFKVIDRNKLNDLSDDVLASWTRRGIISFIDIHLKSLENINTLFTLLNNRQK